MSGAPEVMSGAPKVMFGAPKFMFGAPKFMFRAPKFMFGTPFVTSGDPGVVGETAFAAPQERSGSGCDVCAVFAGHAPAAHAPQRTKNPQNRTDPLMPSFRASDETAVRIPHAAVQAAHTAARAAQLETIAMSVLPDSRKATLTFFETHEPIWTANAAAIGLTPAQTTQLSAYVAATRLTLDAAEASRAQKLADTQSFHNASDLLRGYGSDLVKVIKAFAESTSSPGVYTTAQIPPPATPQPRPAPTPATNLVGTVRADGTIKVTWEGTVANGTFYEVFRRVGATGAFTLVGAADTRSFIDVSVTPGTDQIAYQLVTRRDTLTSTPSASTTVYLGSPGEGAAEVPLAA
jgi:hypothetical protein